MAARASFVLALAMAGLALVLGVALLGVPRSEAATFTVNSAADTFDGQCTDAPGGCTLRDAINAANATGGADVIKFSSSVFPSNGSGPAIVSSGDLTFNATDGITLDGSGAGVTIQVASGHSMFFQTTSGVTAQNITVKNIEIDESNGLGVRICGGMYPDCTAGVQNVTIQNVTGTMLGTSGFTVQGSSLNGFVFKDNQVSAYQNALAIGTTGPTTNVEVSGSTMSAFQGDTVYALLNGPASHINIHDNDLSGSFFSALEYLSVGGTDARIHHNTVHNAFRGIYIDAFVGQESTHVTISRNSTYANTSLGIDLYSFDDTGSNVTPNDVGDTDVGPNNLLNFPVITADNGQTVSGTACHNCKVELFASDNDPSGYGEGQTFLADAVASGNGAFNVPICGLNLAGGSKVTATATDSANTSEFSLNYTLTTPSGTCPTPSPTPSPTASPTRTPTPTPAAGHHKQGDLNCDNNIDGKDALKAAGYAAGLPVSPIGGCPGLGSGTPAYGSVNCDQMVDLADAVAIMQYAAEVAIIPPQPGGCTPLGELLS
ncbi:MAG TPA: CSLREA domain-containing protein [Dehalococcoidia bacterium]|nr:CSLREA domain-containing protein [Dehalococcoidia bacterium]